MRIIFAKENGETEQLIVKVQYERYKCERTEVDQYKRIHKIYWVQQQTVVTCQTLDNMKSNQQVVYRGTAMCKYDDLFKKSIGRQKAWLACLKSMINGTGNFTPTEYDALKQFNCNHVVCKIDARSGKLTVLQD